MKDIELPEPVGFRSRYQSEPGMIGHYPWTYADHRRRKYDRPECEYEDLYTADQLRAAVEADRAQRVPDVWKVEKGFRWDGARQQHIPQLIVEFEPVSFDGPCDAKGWQDRNSVAALLASTPAPAQQEPMEAFLVIDLSRELGVAASELIKELQDQGIGNYSVNMALPKSAAAAMRAHFKSAAQHQEPPQQERKPMTPEEVREGIANHIEDVFRAEKVWTVLQTAAYIRSIEINGRHHGIKE